MNPSPASPSSPRWPKPLGSDRPSHRAADRHDFLVLNQCPELTPELPARLPLPTASGPLHRLRASPR
jgi:hypothetical protein